VQFGDAVGVHTPVWQVPPAHATPLDLFVHAVLLVALLHHWQLFAELLMPFA
jgi:hypothetical protein